MALRAISSPLHTPSHDQDPIAATENELRRALDDLEATGVLQSKNRMDIIEAMLNPAEESQMTLMDDTTDKEICQAVLAAHNAQEEQPIDEEDDTLEPRPTYREVLQAISVINRYAGHVNDPVARKLEAILASFGRQLRLERSQALTTTHITDYFHHI
jgi:hypothetical protein